MSDRITFLHLSDLHAGAPRGASLWHDAKRPFFEHLRGIVREHGPPDAILFTGDLAYAGRDEDYDLLDQALDEIRGALGSEPLLVPVPGNHDIDRREADVVVQASLGRYQDDAAVRRAMLDGDPKLMAAIEGLFSGYQGWFRRRVLENWRARGAQARFGRLPGDFLLSVERGGMRLGVAGWNSAWLHFQDGARHALAVEREQLGDAEVDLTRWSEGHDATLLLQHHPFDWLHEQHRKIASDVYLPDRFAACLFGHVHEPAITTVDGGPGRPRRFLQGSSLFGLERYGTEAERRAFGYGWGLIERSEGTAGRLLYQPFDGVVQADRVVRFRPSDRQDPLDAELEMRTREAATGYRMAVVAVTAELADARRAVADRVRRMREIGVVDELGAEDARAGARLADYDLRIVLVGFHTGGTDVLRAALDPGADFLVAHSTTIADPKLLVPEELALAQGLQNEHEEAPTFDSAERARGAVAGAVSDWLQSRRPVQAADRADLHGWERDYLEQRRDTWERGVGGALLARAGARNMRRVEHYVSMRADPDCYFEDGDGQFMVADTRNRAERTPDPEGEAEDNKRKPAYLEQALSNVRHLVLEGEPGGGKSVLLQHVAYVLALHHLDEGLAGAPHQLDLHVLEADASRSIPFLVRARWVADHLPRDGAGGLETLARALAQEVHEALGQYPEGAFEDALAQGIRTGRYLVLIDALDEVPDGGLQQRVVSLVAGVAQALPNSRLALTTRPSAHTGVLDIPRPLEKLRLAELDKTTAGTLVERWCSANGKPAHWRNDFLAALSVLADEDEAARFATNPQLLVVALLVFAQSNRLPDSLADLYGEVIEILCKARETAGLSSEAKRQILELVFHGMQCAGGTERPIEDVVRLLVTERGEFKDEQAARTGLDRLADHTGLLRFETRVQEDGSEEHVALPWHRSFQEYLAASFQGQDARAVEETTEELFDASPGSLAPVLDPAWTGTLRFLAGVHGAQGEARARAYLGKLHERAQGSGQEPRDTGHLWALVAAGLSEYSHYFENWRPRPDVPEQLLAAYEAHGVQWTVDDRLLALDRLGRLGDPRFERTPWVEVAGGSFPMGKDREAWDVVEEHEVVVPDLPLAWRPVTVGDYAGFVDGGYGEDRFWLDDADSDEVRKIREAGEPPTWRSQRHHPSRPMVTISWYEARAWCRWASAGNSPCWPVPEGHEVALPSETEWEYVATCGGKGDFAWGDDEPVEGENAQCAWKSVRQHATPVGAFPHGEREDGIVDLTGNVWEWCEDSYRSGGDVAWKTADHRAALAGGPRVLRGGSWWSHESRLLRCATRFRYSPGYRFNLVGFRVCLRVSREHVD